MIAMAERNPRLSDQAARRELRWCLARCRAPRLRTMGRFAIDEIVLPSGPAVGRRFTFDRQPFTRLWFEAIDSGRYNRFVATGPSQASKTLCGSLIPLCYHLFEFGERVIFGLPDLDMAGDKWHDEILPVIERTRYRELLPLAGGGSRGGKVQAIRFRNGATLRFMTGGSSDKGRAGYTSRVLIVTEVDGMDTAASSSREANKIAQLERRTAAYGDNKRIYLECTVSIPEGRIWQEYEHGTASRIMLRCPHCLRYVLPEREHLHGWQEAENELAAAAASAFYCPDCGEAWTEADRRQANGAAKLVHRGQEIDAEGLVHGPPPPTNTLGFRWTAAHNLFTPMGQLGAGLWRAARAVSEEDAEREQCQFVWCVPYKAANLEGRDLDAVSLMDRTEAWPKGLVPADCLALGVGCDLGKRLAHYAVAALLPEDRWHVVDYGLLEIPSDTLGTDKATTLALRELRDLCLAGWPQERAEPYAPEQSWIDANYEESQAAVLHFCAESGDRFRPTLGYANYGERREYRPPKKTSAEIRFIGDGYYLAARPLPAPAAAGNRPPAVRRIVAVHVDADIHKGRLHDALSLAVGQPGALTLYAAPPIEHLKFCKHLVAEKRQSEFKPGKGLVVRWVAVTRQNHYLDALSLALGAARHAVHSTARERVKPRSLAEMRSAAKGGRR